MLGFLSDVEVLSLCTQLSPYYWKSYQKQIQKILVPDLLIFQEMFYNTVFED